MSEPDVSGDPVPVLVIAAPRSGSSWFAENLAAAAGMQYRREPLTQEAISRGEDPFGWIAPDALTPEMQREIHAAFAPTTQERILVKEVTPLRLRTLAEIIRPLIVALVRHPLAVAASQHAQGWIFGERVPDRFAPADDDVVERLASGWAELSSIAKTVAYTAATVVVMRRSDIDVSVMYEDFLADPSRFDALATALAPGSHRRTPSQPQSSQIETGPYSTKRPTDFDPHTWRARVSAEDVAASLEVWRSFGLADYPDDEW